MGKWIVSLLVLLIFISLCLAAPFDSGWKEYTQPNGAKFTARYWGDDFQWWMRTDNGYSIIEGNDGYFYYAVLDANGEFTASSDTVGISQPLTASFQLERSLARQAEIDAEIQASHEQLRLNRQWYLNKLASGDTTIKVGVLLVDFTPSERYRPPNYPDGIPKEKFDDLYFSIDTWIGEKGNSPHPDGDALFGSFRDYFRQQSLGKLDIIGTKSNKRSIVNPDTLNGLPNWLVLDKPKSYYIDSNNFKLFLNDALSKLRGKIGSNGWYADDTLNDAWIFMYAGENDMLKGLRIHGGYISDLDIYSVFMSELWRNDINDPNSNIGFSHMGLLP